MIKRENIGERTKRIANSQNAEAAVWRNKIESMTYEELVALENEAPANHIVFRAKLGSRNNALCDLFYKRLGELAP